MSTNAKIKVIKKGTQNVSADKAENLENDKKTAQQAAREMVSTVTNWVSEFQQKRREETKQAIEKLFSPTSQTTQTNGV